MPSLININQTKLVRILFYVLFLNSVIESFLLYFNDRTIIILIQLFLNGAYIVYTFARLRKVKKPPFIRTITLLVALLLVCSIFSSAPITTFNYLLKFVIPFFFYIIGFNIISNSDRLQYFIGKLWIFLAYITIYIIIVNVLNIGESIYSGGLKVGYYSLNGLYIPTFSIIFVLFFYKFIPSKKERLLSLVFTISTILVLIILLKRTLLMIIILGLVIYLIKSLSVKSLFRSVIFGLCFLVIASFFSSFFSEALESRSSRFDKEYEISEEGRFTEIFFIYDYMKNDTKSLIWGTGEVFNDRETVSRIYGVDREAHNSFIRLFWNAGTIGLTLYVLFCFQQFRLGRGYYRFSKRKLTPELSHLFFFTTVFIILRFINDFSSGITYLGYNAFSFIFIGGTFSVFKNFHSNYLPNSPQKESPPKNHEL